MFELTLTEFLEMTLAYGYKIAIMKSELGPFTASVMNKDQAIGHGSGDTVAEAVISALHDLTTGNK